MEIFASIACAIVSAGLIIWFFVAFKKYRVFSDTAETKIRSAPQGYNVLCGHPTRLGLEPLISPLTKTPCCWYKYSISVDKRNLKGQKREEVIESHTSRSPFCIEDETGICLTLPHDANITTRYPNHWQERSKKPIDTGRIKDPGLLHKIFNEAIIGKMKYYYTEEIITSGDKLHIAGFFETVNNSSKMLGSIEKALKRKSSTNDHYASDWSTQIKSFKEKKLPIHLIGKRTKDPRPFVITTASLTKTRRKLLIGAFELLGFSAIFAAIAIYVVIKYKLI